MSTVERDLGWFEKYQVAKQLTRAYGAVTTTVILNHTNLTTKRRNSKDDPHRFYLTQLYGPLMRLVEKHPQLSLVVSEHDKPTAHFVRLDQVDLSRIVKINQQVLFWDRAQLAEIIANECDHEFDLNGHTIPLWHLRVCIHDDRPGECSITFTAHHVIADGKSLSIFWQDLLQEINCINQQQQEHLTTHEQGEGFIIKPKVNTALGLPYEDRQAPMPTAWNMLGVVSKMIAKRTFPSFLTERWFPQGWAGDYPGITDKSLARHDTVVRMIELSGTHWKNLCNRCREHGITPHAATMAAIVSAFTEVYPQITTLSTCTPTNCRSFCTPSVPENEMGNFVGAYTYTWSLQEEEKFWDRAKKYQTSLKANMFEAAKESGLLKYLSKYPDDYCDFWYGHWDSPMHRSGGIEVSDLGKFRIPWKMDQQADNDIIDDVLWKLKSIWFCQSAHLFTSPITVNPIRTEDSLYVTIGWQNGSVIESKFDVFTSLVVRKLENPCQ